MSKDRQRYKSQSGGVKAGRGSDFAQDVVDDGGCGLGERRAEVWKVCNSGDGGKWPSFWLKHNGLYL
jgi:hypothetical protein